MSREKNLAKNTLILSISTIVPKIFSLLSLPIITGYLYKSEYGTYDLITTLATLVLPIATLQLQAAAFRFLIDQENKNEKNKSEVIFNILVFTFFSSIVALTILFFCLRNFSILIRLVIIFYYLLDVLVTTLRQIARGLGENFTYSFSVIISSFFELASMAILLIVYKMGLIGAILSLIIGLFLSLIYLIIKIKIYNYLNFKLFSKNRLKKMLSYSWPLIPNSLSSWVMSLSDRVIVTINMGVEANAIYAIANKIPNMFGIVQSTFTLAWQENASMSINDADSNEYYTKMFDIIFKMLVGLMALLIGFSPIIFKIFIKGDYLESYNHMIILLLAALCSGICSFLGGIYIAHKKTKDIGLTTIVSALINIFINMFLIKFIGIYAASISTLISYLALAIFRMINVQKIQHIKFNVKTIILSCLLMIIMCYLCFRKNLFLNFINIIISGLVFFIFNKNIIKAILIQMKTKI